MGVVLLALLPVLALPVVGPEFASGPVVPTPPASDAEQTPQVAAAGGTALVVWSEGDRVVGTRLDATGAALDPDGILIAGRVSPRIGASGTGFLAAWRAGAEIDAVRISAAGAVLDATPLVLGTDAIAGDAPATSLGVWDVDVASNGAEFVVAWPAAGNLIATRRVPLTGAVTAAEVTHVTGNTTAFHPRIASDGADYMIAWATASDIAAVQLTGAGFSATTMISAAMYRQNFAELAWDGTSYVAAWEDGRNLGNDIYVARVSPAGVVLDPAGLWLGAGALQPRVAAVAGVSLINWSGAGGRSQRLAADGTVLDQSPLQLGHGPARQIAGQGSDFVMVYEGAGIQELRLSAAGAIGTPSRIGRLLPNRQLAPVVASNGAGYLLGWWDYREPQGAYVARISPMGDILDPAGIYIGPSFPTLASNGTDYLVVWGVASTIAQGPTQLFGRTVSASGALSSEVVLASSTQDPTSGKWSVVQRPLVGSRGGEYLFVWSDSAVGRTRLFASVVSAGGVAGTARVIADLAGDIPPALPTSIAASASSYLVTWDHGTLEAHATPVDASGVGGPDVLLDGAGSGPVATFDGAEFVTAWTSSAQARVARISTTGVNVDPGGIDVGAGAYNVWLASNGDGSLLAYLDQAGLLRGMRLDGATSLDPGGFAIQTDAYGGGLAGAAGVPYIATYPTSDMRVMARQITVESSGSGSGSGGGPDADGDDDAGTDPGGGAGGGAGGCGGCSGGGGAGLLVGLLALALRRRK